MDLASYSGCSILPRALMTSSPSLAIFRTESQPGSSTCGGFLPETMDLKVMDSPSIRALAYGEAP